MQLTQEILRKMVVAAQDLESPATPCNDCWDQVDRFAELTLAGKNAAEAMPLIHEHLQRCPKCREEFEALLTVLRDQL